LTIDNKDGLYTVSKVGGFNLDANNKLVIDLWVNDFFPINQSHQRGKVGSK
jgi:hypothetical protein